MKNITERQLVVLAKETLPYNTTFYQQLVLPYIPRLKGYCSKLLQDNAEAEDVVQETLIKVLTQLKSFHWSVSFQAWVFKIAHNECIDRIRGRKWTTHENDDVLAEMVSDAPINTTEQQLQTLLNKLNFEDRNMLLLRYKVGLEFQEIADITHLGLSAVKMRHKRIINTLTTKNSPSNLNNG